MPPAGSPCEFLLRVGPVVVTRADPLRRVGREIKRGGEDTSRGPAERLPAFPQDALFTLEAAGTMFGRSVNNLRVILCRHAEAFDCAHYWSPRWKGDWRRYRVLTEADVATLRRMLVHIVVKENRRRVTA